MSSTVQKLAEITDEGKFELLATAILRQARPEYAALLHPGVNPAGKTVKSPVDGLCFVLGASPPQMIAAHHTTCKRDDLTKKWLHDPATVKARGGRKAAAGPGDLIKTAAIFAAEQVRDPTLRGTLVLTTNQEPSDELVREVRFAASSRGFEVDVWSASRLSDVLDNTPRGQWLRRQYLGVEQELLSADQLGELSSQSLELLRPNDEVSAWVDRPLDHEITEAFNWWELAFVVAESGLGKSVACFKHLAAHVEAGGFGLLITHDVLATSQSVEQAVDRTLVQLAPRLVDPGQAALGLCSAEQPLVVVIEDVNRSAQPALLLEKMIKWATRPAARESEETSGRSTKRAHWRLLCPLWPRTIHLLQEATEKEVLRRAVVARALTSQEARQAVQRRAQAKGKTLTDLDAAAISHGLGNDPLLIALHDLHEQPRPSQVIERFIDSSLTRLAAQRGEYAAAEYRAALRALAHVLVSRRELKPTWSQLLDWISPEVAPALRHLVHAGEIARLSGTAANQRLDFRHDRVRDALLADSFAMRMSEGTADEDLGEPYFADVIGAALLCDGVPLTLADQLGILNPVALFHGLRNATEIDSPMCKVVLRAIDHWLSASETHDSAHWYKRRDALLALMQARPSAAVRQIARRFPDQWTIKWQVLLRNGDIVGGLNLCLEAGPGIGSPWRDESLADAKTQMRPGVTAALKDLLTASGTNRNTRVAALRWAGFLADATFESALECSWNSDANRSQHLEDYLWASAQCCGSDPAKLLAPVCDEWARLSDDPSSPGMPSLRDSLAADNVRWAFSAQAPTSAIGYFLERAATEELRWPILYMLHSVDDPRAVDAVVRELGRVAQELEGSDGFWPFLHTVPDGWRRGSEQGRRMSAASRECLFEIWRSPTNPKHLRRQALRVWAATIDASDLETETLGAFAHADEFDDLILWHRLARSDQEAIPALLLKLKGGENARSRWWSAARGIQSDALDGALEDELRLREVNAPRKWDEGFATDYQTSERLMEMDGAKAEQFLLRHWDHLRFYGLFVQCALYIGTPKLLVLVKEAVAACPTPEVLFRHLHSRYGVRVSGRTGVTRAGQIETLRPYLDFIDHLCLRMLWEECNRRGWFELRRSMLDARLDKKYGRGFLDAEDAFAALDDMVSKGGWVDSWVDGFLKAGASPAEIIGKMAKWLSSRLSLRAMQIVAQVVASLGLRSDLAVLDVAVEPKDEADRVRMATAYAVRRRSLI